MPDSQMSYREKMPCAALRHFVASFWEFTVSAELTAPVTHEVFPDGCVSIFLYRHQNSEIQKLFVGESRRKSIFVPVKGGDTIWGMRILPEAGHAFFGMNPAKLKTQNFDDENLGKRFSVELEKNLFAAANFEQAIESFEAYAARFGLRAEEIDARLAKATQIFIKSKGLAKISETAKEIGLSERQFERNYQKASGFTPKQFARICRFRATAIAMVRDSAKSWANRAADKGFADQSHLNREFSSLSGNSPIEFSENILRIAHGNLLE